MKVNRDGTYGPLVSSMLIMVRCCITHSGLDPASGKQHCHHTVLTANRRAGDGATCSSAVGQAASVSQFV